MITAVPVRDDACKILRRRDDSCNIFELQSKGDNPLHGGPNSASNQPFFDKLAVLDCVRQEVCLELSGFTFEDENIPHGDGGARSGRPIPERLDQVVPS
eukprot:CAMPEP_0183314314 /NCGR_PEP_ID=MMETSP0160_2-20130417/48086_1 /TAXON_ID=2839 ORGANISM="Odontella Sinensis, Strain Grunow 1884" /NCGR_SAMPLE_ID=MMETSP0160_2 /ASSEMBLY_ACC=CAM_ASM_000250 /LENGTH=98 /DNA_ID=CAMNT_0025479617 /DNA_START=87 /DNA_END=379 /DNA_ORIENTATION=-